MKRFKILSFLTVLSLVFAFIAAFVPTKITKASQSDFDCEYYAANTNEVYVNVPHYGCSEVITYTEEQAVEAGIPSGFTGDVISVVQAGTNKGLVLDFSSLKIPTSIVKSISVRVYLANDTTAGYPELRIPKPYSPDMWTFRSHLHDKTEQWVDVEIVEGSNEEYDCKFAHLSKNNYLDKFELAVRNKTLNGPFYIDYIKVNVSEDDGVAPVLTYVGEDHVVIPYGAPLNFNVSATDNLQGEIDVEYIWGDESLLDENGLPKKGEHTLTFKATDYYGHSATKTITITVEEPDVTAPVINCNFPKKIYARAGAIPQFIFTATDDRDGEILATVTWSGKALNEKGQLVTGNWHSMTITATDKSGNESSIRIHVIVTETGESADNVIDESILFPRDWDEEEKESESESESVSTSESVSESESESVSTSESESESISESVSTSESVLESEKESETASESASESVKESILESESVSESLLEEGCGGCGSAPSEETEEGCGGILNASAILTMLLVTGAFIIRKKGNE